MTADSRAKLQRRSSARDCRAAAGMDGNAHNRPPDRRRSTKSKAPPPPVLTGLDAPLLSHKLQAFPHPAMEQTESLLEQELTLTVILPGGAEKITTVHGSKPMMDLLVMLCAQHHLNPSGHTLELITTNRNHVKFKPNALIGALEADKILLKPKGMEDKSKKTGPHMPEATVRLVINYRKTQKTILRVSPRVPLRELLPAICQKCEFDPQTTLLSPSVQSEDTLDLSGSLNDFGLREVYARDTRVISPVSPISPVSLPPSPTRSEIFYHGKEKSLREKDNKRRFSLFRRGSKKQSEQSMTVSAPASPVHRKQRPVSMSSFSTHVPLSYDCNTMPSDTPKKRRAPLPPSMMSQSMPSDLSQTQTTVHPDGNQNLSSLSRASSTESSFKKSSTKRKAPPPPVMISTDTTHQDTTDSSMTESAVTSPLEEIKEQEEMSVGAGVNVEDETLEDNSSLNMSADISLDSGRAGTATPSQDSVTLESGTPRDDPVCDLSTDAEVAEGTVNGEMKADHTRSSHITSEDKDPGKTEQLIQPSESGPVLEEVTVSNTSLPQRSECGIQTSQTDLQVQCFDSDTAISSPESSCSIYAEAQTSKTIPNTSSLTHTETQTQVQSSNEPSSLCTESSTSTIGLKKDMATSTDELQPSIQQSKDLTSTSKPASVSYVTDAEPKPKPSNELTRGYIPKVGMTTYTIVPQKSLEKLHSLEIEMTLEPKVDCKPNVSNGTVTLNGHQNAFAQTNQCTSPPATNSTNLSTNLSTKPTSLSANTTYSSTKPTSLSSSPTYLSTNPTNWSTNPINSSTSPTYLSTNPTNSSTNPTNSSTKQTNSSTNPTNSSSVDERINSVSLKDKKVPPATRPKPASFRVPQHKRMSGDYVSSAAVRRASIGSSSSSSSCCSSPAARPKESLSSPQSDVFPAMEIFPPPPPPVQWEEEQSQSTSAKSLPQNEEIDAALPEAPKIPPSSFLSHQKSLPTNPAPSLSLEKLRSFAAPKPYSPSSPSRFAQAVSSAVKRSQSLSHHAPVQETRTHTLTKQRPIRESPEPPTSTVTDNGDREPETQTADTDPVMGTCKIGNTQASPGSEASSQEVSDVFHSAEE